MSIKPDGGREQDLPYLPLAFSRRGWGEDKKQFFVEHAIGCSKSRPRTLPASKTHAPQTHKTHTNTQLTRQRATLSRAFESGEAKQSRAQRVVYMHDSIKMALA